MRVRVEVHTEILVQVFDDVFSTGVRGGADAGVGERGERTVGERAVHDGGIKAGTAEDFETTHSFEEIVVALKLPRQAARLALFGEVDQRLAPLKVGDFGGAEAVEIRGDWDAIRAATSGLGMNGESKTRLLSGGVSGRHEDGGKQGKQKKAGDFHLKRRGVHLSDGRLRSEDYSVVKT